MRSFLVLLGGAAALLPAAAIGQDRPLDIRNTDLGSHDSFSTPDLHDQILKQRERERSDQIHDQANRPGPSRPAKASELLAGATVNDKTGLAMAKIDSVDKDGIILSMGTAKVKVPAEAFGHNKAGLLLDMTKAQFEQLVTRGN
jgi:hypothetical protein